MPCRSQTFRRDSGSNWSSREKKTWILLALVLPRTDPETRIPGQMVYLEDEGNSDRRIGRGDRKGKAADQVF